MPKERIFLKDSELIAKLETRAGISFTPTTISLFNNKGYRRVKKTLIFMKEHNLKINNKSISSIYKNEKHLRHMVMPRLETFEMKMKNTLLYEISRITNGADPFTVNAIFISSKIDNLKSRCKSEIIRHYKIKEGEFLWSNHNLFDWIYIITMGNAFHMFNALKPSIKEAVYRKLFKKKSMPNNVSHKLDSIRKLRNRIAHAEQLYAAKGQLSFRTNNYFSGIDLELKNSDFKELYKNTKSHIANFIKIYDKYKESNQ